MDVIKMPGKVIHVGRNGYIFSSVRTNRIAGGIDRTSIFVINQAMPRREIGEGVARAFRVQQIFMVRRQTLAKRQLLRDPIKPNKSLTQSV